MSKVQFIDLQSQRLAMGDRVSAVVETVLEHGRYILGPEVTELESALSEYTGANHTITCSDGTDAIRLALLAHNVGPNDAIFVPTFTFASTAEMVAICNATPVFVDVCPKTFNMDPQSLKQAIQSLDPALKPKGIITVDLFGLPANYDPIHEIAAENNLWVIADAAQSFGGKYHGKTVGSLAQMTTTSFFPSKPLACYGDGGAVFTTDPQMAELLESLRNHGCGKHRYDHIHIGLNSRLDTIQAAILLEKLNIFPNELKRRHEIAKIYGDALQGLLQTPIAPEGSHHAWGLYTIVCQPGDREPLIEVLEAHEIPSNVYYRKALHLQPAYRHYPRAQQQLVNAEHLCETVLSLPMHPYLTDEHCDQVIEAVKSYYHTSSTDSTKLKKAATA